MDACPICRCQPIKIEVVQSNPKIHCHRCGDFILGERAFDMARMWVEGRNPNIASAGRFAASHAVRRMLASGSQIPRLTLEQLRLLWTQPLPNPQRQADFLLLSLGNPGLAMDEYVSRRPESFCAEIGTQDDPIRNATGGLSLIMKRLTELKLIEANPHPVGPYIGLRLTFDGWAAYERLRRESVDSKTAFMAMAFSNPVVDKMVAEYFVPAAKETGYDLYRLDDRLKSGLIDNRMRVEIRAAKFLVCDLTDENRGAY
jgi:hypothetical protein